LNSFICKNLSLYEGKVIVTIKIMLRSELEFIGKYIIFDPNRHHHHHK
jgi:hypothetical protein